MNVPFVIAGILALSAAAIHGIAGEKIVVTKLRLETLPTSPFGGSTFTKVMIRATWHIATLAFVVMGSALAVCAPDGSSRACEGVGRTTAIAFASFTALTVGLAVPHALRARRLPRHFGPLIFALVAVLSWWGASR